MYLERPYDAIDCHVICGSRKEYMELEENSANGLRRYCVCVLCMRVSGFRLMLALDRVSGEGR